MIPEIINLQYLNTELSIWPDKFVGKARVANECPVSKLVQQKTGAEYVAATHTYVNIRINKYYRGDIVCISHGVAMLIKNIDHNFGGSRKVPTSWLKNEVECLTRIFLDDKR